LLVESCISMLVHNDAAASVRYMEEARRAGGDPSVWAYNNALLHAGPLGDCESVLSELKEAESTDPLAPNVRLAQIEINLAAGRLTDAVAGAEAAQLLSSQAPMVMLSAAGDRTDAQALLDELLAKGVDGQANACYVIGEGYKSPGEYGRAIEWWSRSVERHEPWSLSFMTVRNRSHPVIGKDPRYLALLERMGLASGAGGCKHLGRARGSVDDHLRLPNHGVLRGAPPDSVPGRAGHGAAPGGRDGRPVHYARGVRAGRDVHGPARESVRRARSPAERRCHPCVRIVMGLLIVASVHYMIHVRRDRHR
jgi:hypothetical protein